VGIDKGEEMNDLYIHVAFHYESTIDRLIGNGLLDKDFVDTHRKIFYDSLDEEKLRAAQRIRSHTEIICHYVRGMSCEDMISLTELARQYSKDSHGYIIQSWMRSRNTLELLRQWENDINEEFDDSACEDLIHQAHTTSLTVTIDDQQQQQRSDATKGIVRLFIASSDADKESIEKQAAGIMAEETKDVEWNEDTTYKSLILEHHMAASRFGFLDLYAPLNESKAFDTSLRDGSIFELSFLSKIISPLVRAYKANNEFEVSRIVRQHSPLMDKRKLEKVDNQMEALHKAENAVDSLLALWNNDNVPSCLAVLRSIHETGLFKLDVRVDDLLSDPTEGEPIKITALRNALSVSFDVLERYSAYVTDTTGFATHQGVKGLEFPRVMVIMDDTEAKGFLFSYEKLFGAKPKTDSDIKNEEEGKDTSIMRTARLFYVACTRAQKSLAAIAYTENIEAVKETAISHGWFTENEIHIL